MKSKSMYRISANFRIQLLALFCCYITCYAQSPVMPLKGELELASGFGDFRSNHFHAGIDFRTGGAVGKPVFSPVDGHVMRLKASYYGYGKVLYIKGNDGYLYVFGHLLDYAPRIDSVIENKQYSLKRYFVDFEIPKDSVRVSRGELVAYSGESGAGAPHLHFEKRTSDNVPLNPLNNGFPVVDKLPPVMTGVTFHMTDDSSLFDNGTRKQSYDLISQAGKYSLTAFPYFHRPFGILVECYDKMRSDGMKQAVYDLALYFDGKLSYRSTFDSLDYDSRDAVRLEYDYFAATQDSEPRVRRLYELSGNNWRGSRGVGTSLGIFGDANTPLGRHTLRVVASDAFGNRSEFETEFYWGPAGSLFMLDSTQIIDSANTNFFFSSPVDTSHMRFDSVVTFVNKLDKWGRTPDAELVINPAGSFKLHIKALSTLSAALRLNVYPENGYPVKDNIFNGIQPSGTNKVRLKYDLVDDGLLLTLYGDIRYAATSRIELYADGKNFETLFPRFYSMQKAIAFIQPTDARKKIDRIDYVLSRDPNHPKFSDDSVHIYAMGVAESEVVPVGTGMEIRTGKSDFFSPVFVDVREQRVPPSVKQFNSKKFVISPDAVLCRNEIKVVHKLNPANTTNKVAGLCRFDDKKNSWKWIETDRAIDSVAGSTAKGGTFATIIDIDPPKIEKISIKHLGTIAQKKPRITMSITDNLAGFADDQNFLIKIDGDWVIPEYDPETCILTVVPPSDLANGEHHLSIEVTDRLGHKAEQYLRFNVNSTAKGNKRR